MQHLTFCGYLDFCLMVDLGGDTRDDVVVVMGFSTHTHSCWDFGWLQPALVTGYSRYWLSMEG